MTASRQRAPRKFDSTLIRKPKQQPRVQRAAWGFVTLGFWALYLYLLVPLLTLVSWAFGVRLAWTQLYERQQQIEPFVIVALPVMLICSAALLIAWAEYNRMRFSGSDRRNPVKDIPIQRIAHDLGADPRVAAALPGCKSVVLHMDDSARPIGCTRQQAMPGYED